ncbi:MAG: hypothetical protein AABY32_01980 [Nanoarchaeota archaeon]
MAIGKYSARNREAMREATLPVKMRTCCISGERLPIAQLSRAELTVNGLSIDFGYIQKGYISRFAEFCVRVKGLWNRKIASMTPNEMIAHFGLRQSEEAALAAMAFRTGLIAKAS